MLSNLISNITPFVESYGVFGIFFLSVVEEIIVPIPSSLPLLAAGFFFLPASGEFLSIFIKAIYFIAIPGALGLTVGALFGYSLAYMGGEALIKKFGKWLGVSWSSIEKTREKFEKSRSDEFIILSLRTLPFIPNLAVSLACGTLRYPIKKFILLTFIGTFLRALLMGMLGWSLGGAYVIYASRISSVWAYFAEIIGGLVILCIVYFIFKKKLKSRKN